MIQYNIISSSYFYLTKNYILNTAPTEIEKKIFKGIQNFFQELPPLASDDYKNGFDDIIAMYGFGGDEYIMINEEYESIISAEISERINKLSIVHKKELIQHYETHYLLEFLNDEGDGYEYNDEDFIEEMLGNFKIWVYDNFSTDDLEEEDDEYVEEYEEFNKSRSEQAVAFIKEVIKELQTKDFSDIKNRRLEIALIYLSYHPLAPNDEYQFHIGFKHNDLFFSIDYSSYLIKIEIYNTEDGQFWHSFKDEITTTGYTELIGFYDEYKPFFLSSLEEKNTNQIAISNELP